MRQNAFSRTSLEGLTALLPTRTPLLDLGEECGKEGKGRRREKNGVGGERKGKVNLPPNKNSA